MENKSEVARILSEIEAQYTAGHNGLHGLAQGMSDHEFMVKRTENIGRLHRELQAIVGENEAMPLIAAHLDQAQDQPSC